MFTVQAWVLNLDPPSMGLQLSVSANLRVKIGQWDKRWGGGEGVES